MKKEKKIVTVTDTENVDNFVKRERLRWAIMIMSVITIALAIASLAIKLNILFPLGAYIVTHILITMRNKVSIQESELVKIKREERVAKKSKKKEEKQIKTKKKTNK
jgi:cytochrome b subunit of formate dehydrogenase